MDPEEDTYMLGLSKLSLSFSMAVRDAFDDG